MIALENLSNLTPQLQNGDKEPIFDEANNKNTMNKLNVFTESGSLSPLEILAVFHLFQKTPEYMTSSFHQQCKDYYKKSTNDNTKN